MSPKQLLAIVQAVLKTDGVPAEPTLDKDDVVWIGFNAPNLKVTSTQPLLASAFTGSTQETIDTIRGYTAKARREFLTAVADKIKATPDAPSKSKVLPDNTKKDSGKK